ncbi:hypothetical protein BROUX41_003385 [Berkeleyomyces rouxiae]
MSQRSYKNLSYTAAVPPFLARLRGQNPGASSADGPDPILAARRRPAGVKRSASEEAENAPVVLDEDGNAACADIAADGTVSMKPNTGGSGAEEGKEKTGDDDQQTEASESSKKQETAAIGSPGRKRRAAKVVGADDDNDDQSKDKNGSTKQKKKKAKKIKLSFDEE